MKLTTTMYEIELEKALKEAGVPITDFHTRKVHKGFEILMVINGRISERFDWNALVDFNNSTRFKDVKWMQDTDNLTPHERLQTWLKGLVQQWIASPKFKTKYGE